MTSSSAALADRVKHDIQCTSKHRTLAQVEWSRQISRETEPFFVAKPTANVRGSYGAEKPRKHMSTLNMERQEARSKPAKPDPRSYEPKLYEELHPHCSADIGRSAGRGEVFGKQQHAAETVAPLPDWGKGKKSFLPKASRFPEYEENKSPTRRATSLTPEPTTKSATPYSTSPRSQRRAKAGTPSPQTATPMTFSAYRPLPSAPTPSDRVEKKPTGGSFAKSPARIITPAPDHDVLNINYDTVHRNKSTVKLATSTRTQGRPKYSDKMREMFRQHETRVREAIEQQQYSLNPDDENDDGSPRKLRFQRRRMAPGYAPQRHSERRDVDSILRTADADVRRARKLVEANFNSHAMSNSRSVMLYTPLSHHSDDDEDGSGSAGGLNLTGGSEY